MSLFILQPSATNLATLVSCGLFWLATGYTAQSFMVASQYTA